jgi:anti-sigma regulatory factor (Ser/Thr protein kinase)
VLVSVVVLGVVVVVVVGLPVVVATGVALLALVAGVGARVTGRRRRVRPRSAPRRTDTRVRSDGPRWETRWDVHPPVDAVPSARGRLSAVLDDWGLDGELRENVLLVGTELLSNAVEHGGAPVQMVVEAHGGGVRVEVHDAAGTAPRPRAPEPWGGRGRGLQLVDSLSADWGWTDEPDGKIVWADVPDTRSSRTDADHPDDR